MTLTLAKPLAKSPAKSPATSPPERPARAIVQRTRGLRHGPITRLMSPSDLGEILKPFVFLDLFDHEGAPFNGPLHPHSGIATLTWVAEDAVSYVDPDGTRGTLPAGGVEWMQAGRGMWHGGGLDTPGRTRGFQLWIALPPELELGPTASLYQGPEYVPQDGPARDPSRPLRVRSERHRVPVADQLSRGAPESGRTLALPAAAGPHRPVGRGRLGHRVDARRIAAPANSWSSSPRTKRSTSKRGPMPSSFWARPFHTSTISSSATTRSTRRPRRCATARRTFRRSERASFKKAVCRLTVRPGLGIRPGRLTANDSSGLGQSVFPSDLPAMVFHNGIRNPLEERPPRFVRQSPL